MIIVRFLCFLYFREPEKGKEAILDMNDNIESVRRNNELNGIFIGDEVYISPNLRAWLKEYYVSNVCILTPG